MVFTLILLGYSIINIILEVQAGEGGSYVTLLKLVLGITLIWLGVSEEKYWHAGTGKGKSEVTIKFGFSNFNMIRDAPEKNMLEAHLTVGPTCI